MTDVSFKETAVGHWGAEIADNLMGFAQAALDMTALVLVAALILVGQPDTAPGAAVPVVPGPMATAVCHADCIETLPLQKGAHKTGALSGS